MILRYIKNKSPKVGALRLFNVVTLKEASDLLFVIQIYITSFSLPKVFNENFKHILNYVHGSYYDINIFTHIKGSSSLSAMPKTRQAGIAYYTNVFQHVLLVHMGFKKVPINYFNK